MEHDKPKETDRERGNRLGARAATDVISEHGITLARINLEQLEADVGTDFDKGYAEGYRRIVKAMSR